MPPPATSSKAGVSLSVRGESHDLLNTQGGSLLQIMVTFCVKNGTGNRHTRGREGLYSIISMHHEAVDVQVSTDTYRLH